MYKQVIVVRKDLDLSKGKMAAQVAHASLEAYKRAKTTTIMEWELSGSKKVVLRVDALDELKDIYKKAKDMKLPISIISDAGRTHLKSGTITCVGIGPEKEVIIDKLTKHLKLVG